MIGIVIIAHGNLARELLLAAEIIAGQQEHVVTLGLHPDDAIADLPQRIADGVASLGETDGVLALVDLFGGSPGNAAVRCLGQGSQFDLITGVNLPMLLEVLMQRDTLSLEELGSLAIDAGQTGIRDLGAALRQVQSPAPAAEAPNTPCEGD